jgi:hypothetical protein
MFEAEDWKKVSEDGLVRTPSDHLGLVATFKFIE